MRKILLSLSLALFVTVIAACGNSDESAEENNNEENDTQEEGGEGAEQPEMPEPDLEGIPDIVAEVNGEEISREEFEMTYTGQFQQAAMQSQMAGQEVDQDQLKEQIVEGMIGQELLVQGADKGGFDASEEDIDETLNGLVEQNELESKDEFLAALEDQGMDEEEVMSELAMQVKVDQLVASETGDIEPTNEELEDFYEQVVAQQEQMGEEEGEEAEIPAFDEIKPDLINELKGQKEAEAVQTLVEKFREEADVTVHL